MKFTIQFIKGRIIRYSKSICKMIKFEIYIGQDGLYHWRLKAINGEIVCWGEGYSSFKNAQYSIAWVKSHAPSAPVYTLQSVMA